MAIRVTTSVTSSTITATITAIPVAEEGVTDRELYFYIDGNPSRVFKIGTAALLSKSWTYTKVLSHTTHSINIFIRHKIGDTWSEEYNSGDISVTTTVISTAYWSWTSAQGSASAAQVQAAYSALTNASPTANMSYLVWNAMVARVYEICEAHGTSWLGMPQYEQCLASSSDKVIYASKFNAVTYNLTKLGVPNWPWEVDRTIEGYIGRREFVGASDVGSPRSDVVYGSYFIALADAINMIVAIYKEDSSVVRPMAASTSFTLQANILDAEMDDYYARRMKSSISNLFTWNDDKAKFMAPKVAYLKGQRVRIALNFKKRILSTEDGRFCKVDTTLQNVTVDKAELYLAGKSELHMSESPWQFNVPSPVLYDPDNLIPIRVNEECELSLSEDNELGAYKADLIESVDHNRIIFDTRHAYFIAPRISYFPQQQISLPINIGIDTEMYVAPHIDMESKDTNFSLNIDKAEFCLAENILMGANEDLGDVTETNTLNDFQADLMKVDDEIVVNETAVLIDPMVIFSEVDNDLDITVHSTNLMILKPPVFLAGSESFPLNLSETAEMFNATPALAEASDSFPIDVTESNTFIPIPVRWMASNDGTEIVIDVDTSEMYVGRHIDLAGSEDLRFDIYDMAAELDTTASAYTEMAADESFVTELDAAKAEMVDKNADVMEASDAFAVTIDKTEMTVGIVSFALESTVTPAVTPAAELDYTVRVPDLESNVTTGITPTAELAIIYEWEDPEWDDDVLDVYQSQEVTVSGTKLIIK